MPALTRPLILVGAKALVEREGYSALTMRRLAEELGSAPMSLYRHVDDKAQLITLLLDEAVPSGGLLVDPALPPRDRVVDAFLRLHQFLASTPWVIDVLADGTIWATRAMDLTEGVVESFVEMGLDVTEAAASYGSLWLHLLGSMLVHHRTGRDPASARAAMVEAVAPDRHPRMDSVFRGRTALAGSEMYAWALPRFVDGLLAA